MDRFEQEQLELIEIAYDGFAPGYDRRMAVKGFAGNALLRQALQDLREQGYDFDSVLDLGAGTGATVAVAMEKAAPKRVVAVDMSKGMLERLRQNWAHDPRVEPVIASSDTYFTEIAAAGDRFDLVTAIGTVIHRPRILELACQVSKVLNGTGYFIFNYSPLNADRPQNAKPSLKHDDGVYTYFWDPEVMEDELKDAGFVDIKNNTSAPISNDFIGGFVVARVT